MCDYSLHCVSTRQAVLGDELFSKRFSGTLTRGFASADAPETAVCLEPGTEIAFDTDVECARALWLRLIIGPRKIREKVARFRQVDLHYTYRHHDALEFASGKTVLVTDLREGQRLRVLQLPHSKDRSGAPEALPLERALI